jgi:8-oxo-dGTP pyrophosphatase MutT (NUDIX family)
MNNKEFYPDSEYLSALQQEAEADGRQCVVGGLVKNEAGAIFVQKRSMDRRLFPGCWDIVGGHVEPGETLYGALAREVEEETGLQLVEILSLVKVFDWEEERDGRVIQNREFDFLVRVSGDLSAPQIEADKFTEGRWVDKRSLAVLLENRPDGETVIQEIVGLGLETAE